MEALIQITTDAQGTSVVSARELHGFLEVRSRYADWFKNRADKYGLVEGQDFVTLSKNLESGGREIDHALTMDCAKELAMVQNNEQGKRARQYFIDCEKQLRQVAHLQQPVEATQPAAPSLTEQLMLQLVQQNAAVLQNQQVILDRLQSDIASIQRGGKKGKPQPRQLALPLSASESMPNDNKELRRSINYHINEYCGRVGCNQQEAYRYLYKRLQAVYGFNVYQCGRGVNETVMEAVERYGQLDRLYSLVRAELAYQE